MKENYTHVAVVLDRSGSMDSIRSDTIGGFNSFLDDQKKEKGECTITLVQFDDKYEVNYDFKKLKEVKPLNEQTYVPRGMTALLDAIGKTIITEGETLSRMNEDDRPEKVIFIILTDGLENMSKEYQRSKIMEMINEQEEKYKWKFLYLGANQDAINEGATFGIKAGNALSYAANSTGMKASFATMNKSVCNLRDVGMTEYCSTKGFDEEDREIHNNILDEN